jgi:hypothetical protein
MVQIATLATEKSFPDVRILLRSLELWYKDAPPTVYIYTDSACLNQIRSLGYKGQLHTRVALDAYSRYTRASMERMPGVYGSLWAQFMAEKISLLEWAFSAGATNIWFLDADICCFGPLPEIPPRTAVALSPHEIRPEDESRYGKFNGGCLWICGGSTATEALAAWRGACETSRFYEQAALEVFEQPEWSGRVHYLGTGMNYGWWRLWQGSDSWAERLKAWSLRRDPAGAHSGICVGGTPLLSVHTHWVGSNEPADVAKFNEIVRSFLRKLGNSYAPARALMRILSA